MYLFRICPKSCIQCVSQKSCAGGKGLAGCAFACFLVDAFAGDAIVHIGTQKVLPGCRLVPAQQAVGNGQHPGVRSVGTADFGNGLAGKGVGVFRVADHGAGLQVCRIIHLAKSKVRKEQQTSRRLIIDVILTVKIGRPAEEALSISLHDHVGEDGLFDLFCLGEKIGAIQPCAKVCEYAPYQHVIISKIGVHANIIGGL